MTRHRGILLTLLQIHLVTSFPHGTRHHNATRDFYLNAELDIVPSSPVVPAPVDEVFQSIDVGNAPGMPSIPTPLATLPSTSVVISTPSTIVTDAIPPVPTPSLPVVPTTSSLVSQLPELSPYTASSIPFLPEPQLSSSEVVVPSSTVVLSSTIVTDTPTFSSSTIVFTSTTSSATDSTSVSIPPLPTSVASVPLAPSIPLAPSLSLTPSAPLSIPLPVTSGFGETQSTTAGQGSTLSSSSSAATSSLSLSSTSTPEVYPSPTSSILSSSTCTETTSTPEVYPTSTVSSSTIETTSTATRSKSSKSSSLTSSLTSSLDTTTTTTTKSTRTKSASKSTTTNSTSTRTKSASESITTTSTAVATRTHSHTFDTTSTATPKSSHTRKASSEAVSTNTVVTFITKTRSETQTTTNTAQSSSPPALAPSHSTKKHKKPKKPTTSSVPQFTSTPEVTLETTLTVSDIQTLTFTTTTTPGTTGTLRSKLNTVGQNTEQPFKTTVIATPTHTIKPIKNGKNHIDTTVTATPTAKPSVNIFVPIGGGAPPPQISTNPNHPVPRLGINNAGPIETNKFYANFFLGTRTASTFTHPYSVAWVQGQGVSGSWGISVQQVTRSQTVYGPGSPPSYFINPLGLQQVILSARELGGSTDLTMDHLTGFSCNVNLAPVAGAANVLTFPLVQGMGFVTAVYTAGTPMLQSSINFQTLTYGGIVSGGVARYSVTLFDNSVWLIYVSAKSGSSVPTLTLTSATEILGNIQFSGTIQVAKIPDGSSVDSVQGIYDAAAGVYPVKAAIQGSTSKAQGSYSISWTKAGKTGKTLLMFALPHHVQSFASSSSSSLRPALKLDTTTKGKATAIVADSWDLSHDDLPFDMGFAPWTPKLRSQTKLSETAQALIRSVAASELSENFAEQTDLDSMYYSGKGLAKFAAAIYATNNLAKDTGTASAGLMKLKDAFAVFVNNQQIFPLVYDSAWGGAVSSCSYTTGSDGCDFGNTYYNDHHFHYGYFVYSAAVIAYLDPTWLTQGTNKAWVNMLVRDYANPVSTDGYFPFQRNFDWYHGHSWAHGLYETFDGKDQESSSEDTFSIYALKMWGRVIGDANMEARGNLMLAVQAQSLQHYYLLQDNNKVEPAVFIPNKAAGIMFENKIDHTTYFGTNPEYIEGIHMIPVAPASSFTRTKAFVSQEWSTYFSDGRVDAIDSGWKGILYANLAIIDPVTAYNFFAQPNFDPAWLDGGASRTWYLSWCAGLGGAPS